MAITAILEVEIKPDNTDAAKVVLARVVAETRLFDGCLGVEAFESPDSPNRWILFERWESAEHDAAYRSFRAGPGAITDLGEHLAAAPKLTMYTTAVDI